ncbi:MULTISPECIES: hypothetical protein [Flavobacterium]|uniref:Uncharacterized protein n=1 Tax=Flavobacterium keumense TaxID=1306518 RepID=A0ABY8N7M0_9FLAO|nr:MULTISPECIES: hypothetical protein [Flavobacterium]WGK95148.1 hypothetical protein MG292_02655 [Flavobacterium keumense]
MKKQLILTITFGIFLMIIVFFIYSGSFHKINSSVTKFTKLNKRQKLQRGEWISNTDSLSGISIRENKIAFFKNMKFTSEDIYEYKIFDSIYKNNKSENKVGEYLVIKDFSDTIYYQIIKKNDTSITLKLNETKTETFNLKTTKLKKG